LSEQAQPDELSYERALELLDQQLHILEEGDVTLEQALAAVEEARRYLKVCNDRLEEARRKIEVRPEVAAQGPPES
jgi:exodeoxyribonuclease VII small subunit